MNVTDATYVDANTMNITKITSASTGDKIITGDVSGANGALGAASTNVTGETTENGVITTLAADAAASGVNAAWANINGTVYLVCNDGTDTRAITLTGVTDLSAATYDATEGSITIA